MDRGNYAVASTLIKYYRTGNINIMTDLRNIEAISKEEAIGIYITNVAEEFPGHNVNCRPVAMKITEEVKDNG